MGVCRDDGGYIFDDDDDDDDGDDGDDDGVKNKMPNGWFFSGYFAFLLWGPFVEPKKRLTIFGEKRD